MDPQLRILEMKTSRKKSSLDFQFVCIYGSFICLLFSGSLILNNYKNMIFSNHHGVLLSNRPDADGLLEQEHVHFRLRHQDCLRKCQPSHQAEKVLQKFSSFKPVVLVEQNVDEKKLYNLFITLIWISYFSLEVVLF